MIDATSGDVIRKLPDAHAPQTAVLHLRFTFVSNLALCGDSSGCVFILSFNRRLGVRSWDSKCLFSGARGEVCAFEPLVQGYDTNFLNKNILVAMATMSKVTTVSPPTFHNQLQLLFLGDCNFGTSQTEGTIQSAIAQDIYSPPPNIMATSLCRQNVSTRAGVG